MGDSDGGASTIQDAFSLVGNDVRAGILLALAEAGDDGVRETLPFSAVRELVDPSMDTSQFNYHLQKLVPTFVEKVEAGYRLHPRGVKLYRAVVAGNYTGDAVLAPIEAGFDCHFCDSPVIGRYEHDRFTIRCSYCRHVYARHLLPPSLVADRRDVLRRVDRAVRADIAMAAEGVCPVCLSELDLEFRPADGADSTAADRDLDLVVVRTCGNCGLRRVLSVGEAMVGRPEVIAFAHDRGLDVTSVPIWELEFAATDRHLTVDSRDPWRVSLSVPVDGETLVLTVDDDLAIESATVW